MKYRTREVLFREAVLAFMGVKTDEDVRDEYCAVCKVARKDIDCARCDRKIEVKKDVR